MAKLPALMFYPGDWMKDPALRSVSLEARGLWIDMLCLMHESPKRGYLCHGNGLPVLPAQLARMTGCAVKDISRVLAEMERSSVFSKTDDGIIYNRRMVADEHKRILCVEAGKRGGNPNILKGRGNGKDKPGVNGTVKGQGNPKPTPLDNPKPTPSCSSSVSVSASGQKTSPGGEGADARLQGVIFSTGEGDARRDGGEGEDSEGKRTKGHGGIS